MTAAAVVIYISDELILPFRLYSVRCDVIYVRVYKMHMRAQMYLEE